MELLQNESRRVYLSRINKVQDYIERHLEDELCIQQLAGIASFSEYHFQRITDSLPEKTCMALSSDSAWKRLTTMDPVRVLYLRHTGAYKGDLGLFQNLFSRLYDYSEQEELIHSGTKWYALYHDYSDLTEENRLRVSIAISIREDVNSKGEFGCTEIAGGRYAVGRFLLGMRSIRKPGIT